VAVVGGIWRIVDTVNGDRDRRGIALRSCRVRGLVGEADFAGEVRRRVVREGAAGLERERAFFRGRAGYEDGGQRIAVGVVVVEKHAAVCVDLERRVLVGRVPIVPGYRPIVDGGHFYRDRRGLARLVSVVGAIGEGVCAVEVVVRRVGEGAVLVQHHGPVGRLIDDFGSQCVAVGVLVVLEDAGRWNAQRRVFFRRVAVVGSNRGVIGTLNGDRDHRGLARLVSVVGAISEGVRAVEVVVRRVGEGAVSVQRYGPVGGRVDELCGQRIAVCCLVVP